MKSFAGQDLTATLIDEGNGKTQVIVGGTLARHGTTMQLGAWGEKKALSKKWLAQLGECLERRASA